MRQASLSVIFAALLLCGAACTVGVGTVDDDDTGDSGDDGGDGENPPPTTPVVHSILAGSFSPMTGYTGIGGRAQMVRWLDGNTSVDAQIRGLTPGIEYTVHVHAASCAFQGGGHYKIDPAQIDTIEENELWLKATASADGLWAAEVMYPHLARGEALSLVIHDPAGGTPPPKMACADLLPDDTGGVEATGTIAPFALAEAIDQNIGGTVTMMRDGTGTHVNLSLTGLDPATIYGSHIHAQPCDVTDGGGHYKIDPTVVDVLEANELWPQVLAHDAGSMTSTYNSAHKARFDAQSLVVHRTVDEATKPKVACADLTRASWPGLGTEGDAITLPAGTSAGLTVTGNATMSRTLAGITQVTLSASGLAADSEYGVHVHALPCSVTEAGGHYKFDTAVADPVETNEIWLKLTTDGAGTATDTAWVNHLARSDAQSLVIHDADKNKVACLDLD
jgi:hypothetical protein